MADCDSKPYGSIYLVTNTVNGKVYVGQTTMSLHARWRAHCTCRGSRVGAAIQKHGREKFSIELICVAGSQQELDAMEISHIARLNAQVNGYNATAGGYGASIKKSRASVERGASKIRGRKMTDEQVQKMAATKRNRPRTPAEMAVLNRMKEMRTGAKHSLEARIKMSESLIGYKRPPATETTKQKLAEAARKQWASGRGHSQINK